MSRISKLNLPAGLLEGPEWDALRAVEQSGGSGPQEGSGCIEAEAKVMRYASPAPIGNGAGLSLKQHNAFPKGRW